MLKKLIAILSSIAILMSSSVVFASDAGASQAPDEQPYGTKYIKHSLLNFYSDNTFRADKQTSPDYYAAHVTETMSYSGSKALFLDSCNHWWKQYFHSNYCEMTEANSNVNSGDLHYVNPNGKQIEFSMKLAGDFSHIPSNAGLLDTSTNFGTKENMVQFSEMNVKIEEIDGVTWRTYSWSGIWQTKENGGTDGGTGYILGIGGTHACGAYIDDLYLKVGDIVVIDENFENAVNTDLSTVDSVSAAANESAVRLSWTNPYFADLTKLEVYDITDGANTQVLSLSAADTSVAPNVVFTQNADCYLDIADAAAASKQYKIVTSTAYFADVETTVDYTPAETEPEPEPEPDPVPEVTDTKPYSTMYVQNPYFRFYGDADLWKLKQSTPANYTAHISEQKSYSGSKSLYMDVCNAWWKQFFSTDYGCALTKNTSNVDAGNGKYYVNPNGKTVEFSMKLAGDFYHMTNDSAAYPNGYAGLLDDKGIQVGLSMMDYTTETVNGVEWRTYSWSGEWPGTGWLMGIGGIHACGAYIDDIYLKVGNVVVINENFDTSTNVDVSNIQGANVTPVNDTTLRIGWVNPYMTGLTKLDIYDITDGTEASVLSLSAADTTVAPNVSFTVNTKSWFDITGLEAETYKKYKIVASSAYFTDKETIVEGRTMKAENTLVSNNYDEKGFAFGGSWIANVGDSVTGANGEQGKWSVCFDEKRSGNASFKINHYGKESRLQYYLADASGTGRTLTAGTTYTFEVWAKTGDGMPLGSSSLFLLNGSTVVYASYLGSITDGDWQKLTYSVTPEANTVLTNIKLSLNATYPTEIYVDDISFSSGSDNVISVNYSDAGVRIDNTAISVADGQKAVTWKYALLDANAAGTVGFNVYHIDSDGVETKLNDSPIEMYEAVDSTLSYNIDTLLPGTYEVRLISSLGFEAGAVSTTVEDVIVSEGTFKTVYWNEGFNQYGENYDEGMSFDAAALTSYGDTVGTISVTNYSEEHTDGLPVCLIGALYKDGTLVNVVKHPTTTVAYGEITSLSVAFETSQISDLTGYEMKLLLWDAATGMTPLTTGEAPSIAAK